MRPGALRSIGRVGAEDPASAQIGAMVRLALGGAQPHSESGRDHPSEYDVASYLERRLVGASEEAFELHVARCAGCAQELVFARRAAAGQERPDSRRIWKVAAAVAIAIGGLIAALLAAGAMGGRLDATMLAGVQGVLGDKIRVEGASLTIAGGPAVELANLTVPDPTGGDPIVSAPSARWDVDLSGLGRGRVAGALRLDNPIINVVRNASGGLNIDAILPRMLGSRDLVAEARRDAIHSVQVTSGTVRLIDRSGSGRREIRMAAVDAMLTDIGGTAPAHVTARAGLESTRQNLSLSGEMGPWGGEQKPVYRFSAVSLDGVAVRNLPGIGSVVRGGLSFDGSLASAGDNWGEISSQFSGDGDLRVVSGSFVGRNLVQDVLAPLVGSAEPGLAPAGDLATLLVSSDTDFGELHSPVRIAGSRIEASDFVATGNGYSVTGRGSLAGDGRVEFAGQIDVSPGTTRELLALAPGAGALVNDHGQISVPFSVSGTWPSVRVGVDVDKLARRTLLQRLVALFFRMPDQLRG